MLFKSCSTLMKRFVLNNNIWKSMSKAYRLFLFILMLSCNKDLPESICYHKDYPPGGNHKVTINQGLWGDVWYWKGDFQPEGFGTICQVKREIYIFALTTMDDVLKPKPYGPFYSKINTNLVTTIKSDTTGFFQVALEPGSYSLFVKEDTCFYSNLSDGHGAIFPVTIDSGKVVGVRIDITYEAID